MHKTDATTACIIRQLRASLGESYTLRTHKTQGFSKYDIVKTSTISVDVFYFEF